MKISGTGKKCGWDNAPGPPWLMNQRALDQAASSRVPLGPQQVAPVCRPGHVPARWAQWRQDWIRGSGKERVEQLHRPDLLPWWCLTAHREPRWYAECRGNQRQRGALPAEKGRSHAQPVATMSGYLEGATELSVDTIHSTQTPKHRWYEPPVNTQIWFKSLK